MPTNEITVS